MNRTKLVAVVCIGLAVLAGCTAIPSDQSALNPTNPNTSTNPEPLDEYPAGFSANGVTDVDVAIDTHRVEMVELNTWNGTLYQYVGRTDEDRYIIDKRTINNDQNFHFERTDMQNYGPVFIYRDVTDHYTYTPSQENDMYGHLPKGYNASDAMLLPILSNYLGWFNYTHTETVRNENGTYITYTATEMAENQVPDEHPRQNISATLTITDEGRITHFEYSADDTNASNSVTNITVDIAINEMEVVPFEPHWIEEVKNEAGVR